jgi:hypothetical protein
VSCCAEAHGASPLRRGYGSQARADLKRALQSIACDVLAWYERHDIRFVKFPDRKFREHRSLPSQAARFFAESRHSETSRRTCS